MAFPLTLTFVSHFLSICCSVASDRYGSSASTQLRSFKVRNMSPSHFPPLLILTIRVEAHPRVLQWYNQIEEDDMFDSIDGEMDSEEAMAAYYDQDDW
ncbi:hypothetical protein JAAARDRAFT_351199 [Jaapia argillacea MUCL 33604]|uniref:Uncharacterized protein n=1 Tax=Jaapia argillacea MUCL 33604 TaxID=933084 RepID=A0A067PWY6_9AGAM|nr:hypothetical protein JAAARDRAFT_351199 [Jaapia argillacea MUCL 33604]